MKKSTRPCSSHRGFALIATILLMVLLAIITVGTLSLSVVTMRSGGHESAQGVARANARMALMIAIGELQKQVGPDQRITANSSITNTGVVPNPNWLGVWDSWIAGDLASTKVNSLYSSAGNSTHQTIGSQPDPLMRPTYAQKNRHFRGWLISLYPEDVVNISAPMSVSLNGKKLPLISDETVLLVSNGSAGSSSAATDVSARLINLKPETDQSLLRGRYAWWVGDESQKATIMDDSYRTESELTMAQRLFRQEAPDSMGNTSVTGLKDMTDETQLANVASLKSIELLDGVGPEKARPRFHDLTTTSYGVLADVREGGLKRDLNTILERNIDPNEVYDFTTVAEFQRASSMKPGAQDFMLYNFDSLLTSISPTGMANVPIQDLAAYYQLYDHNRPDWKGGVQYSTSQSSPPNTRLNRGAMVSTPDLGHLGNDYDKYLRQYTYQYRSVAPVKQEILLHFVTEQRDFAAETTAWLNANRLPPVPPATIGALRTVAEAEAALRIPQDPYNLKIGVSPSMTFWNPNNVAVVMNDYTTFPLAPGTHPMGRQDKTAMTWNFGDFPLNFTFKRGTSPTDPSPSAVVSRSLAGMYDSAYRTIFYTNGDHPMSFQPGESKVVALQGTSLTNPDSGLTVMNFRSIGGGGGSDNEHFVPQLELIPGWNPNKFARSSTQTPLFTFSSSDYISVDVTQGGGSLDFGGITTVRQARNLTSGSINTKYSFHVMGLTTRYNADATYASNYVHMGFPRVGRGGIVNTAARPINIAPRQADGLISAMGNPTDFRDDVPQTFFYFGRKAATETHESRNFTLPGGATGRRFPSRPFLHSPFAQSMYIDNLDGASLYDFGWNWYCMPLNNLMEAPISISGSNAGYFGGGHTAESGTTHLVQQQLPLTPPISIAALSHARLGGYSLATEAPGYLLGNWPWPDYRIAAIEGFRRITALGYGGLAPKGTQAIGNSYAHPSIPAGKAFTVRNRSYIQNVNTQTPFVDHSYLANKALWDEFFFSSITPIPLNNPIFNSSPKTAKEVAEDFFFNKEPLPNRRMQPYMSNMNQGELDELFVEANLFNNGMADKLAAHLLVKGTFNVNSTSVEAWKAMFSSLKGKPVAYLDKDTSLSGDEVNLKEAATTGVPVGSGGAPNAGSYVDSSSDPSDPEQWIGWRELTDIEIEQLAIAMVKQVKLRGPFLSLSEFVNRRLDSSNPTLSVKGALQSALDDVDVSINAGFRSTKRIFSAPEKAFMNPVFPEAMDGAIAYGSNAYVDQADILRNMAEQLSPRGDTFIIRTYGDSIDKNGKVMARAWCEAVVQRTPEYVDSSDYNYLKQASLSSERNKTFGRKLEIIRFRWLNESEV